jgi:hypothetical protein
MDGDQTDCLRKIFCAKMAAVEDCPGNHQAALAIFSALMSTPSLESRNDGSCCPMRNDLVRGAEVGKDRIEG